MHNEQLSTLPIWHYSNWMTTGNKEKALVLFYWTYVQSLPFWWLQNEVERTALWMSCGGTTRSTRTTLDAKLVKKVQPILAMIWKAKQNAFLTHLKCSWIWIWLFWGKFEKVKLIPGTSGRFLRDVQGTHGRHFGETQWTHQPSTFSAFLTLLQPTSRICCTRPDVFYHFLSTLII